MFDFLHANLFFICFLNVDSLLDNLIYNLADISDKHNLHELLITAAVAVTKMATFCSRTK